MQARPAALRWLQARHRSTLSTILQPFDQVPHNQQPKEGQAEEECVSSRLLASYGIVRPAGPGTFSLLPLGLRAQHKLVRLIDEELGRVGCQRLALPSLTPAGLWRRSGRLEGQGKELVRLTDRQGREVLLAPTHEETVTSLLAGLPVVTMAQLPLRLYQVGPKFRDEMRPKFGLIRACEFTMQDLYTFDCDEEAARRTYSEVSEAYRRIFRRLAVPVVEVEGDGASMGAGSLSHEFHFPASVGQDTLVLCDACGASYNSELGGEEEEACRGCGAQGLRQSRGIEVAHTFLLGTRYSRPFNAQFRSSAGRMELLQMGCYGIGVSRVLAAAVEVLSSPTELRWPLAIAPFAVALLAPKAGSREEAAAGGLVAELEAELERVWPGEVVTDDRGKLTVGKKLREARKTGYPHIVLAGKGCLEPEPRLELHLPASGEVLHLAPGELVDYLRGVKQGLECL